MVRRSRRVFNRTREEDMTLKFILSGLTLKFPAANADLLLIFCYQRVFA